MNDIIFVRVWQKGEPDKTGDHKCEVVYACYSIQILMEVLRKTKGLNISIYRVTLELENVRIDDYYDEK